LLAKEKVMFNLDRPLVIYESMTLNMQRLDFETPMVEMLDPSLEINGKRATAHLHFQIRSESGDVVGIGFKRLTVGSLRDYEHEPLQAFVEEYLQRKNNYLACVQLVAI